MNVEALSPELARPRGNFFVLMAFAIIAVAIYGFSFTVMDNLFHPDYPRPAILYVHSIVFPAWLLMFLAQATLVRVGRPDLHRALGKLGVGLGCVMPFVGIATAIAMTRLRVAHGELDAAGSFLIPLFDTAGFTTTFALAYRLRFRPEFHRRLMYMATAILTAAAWGRMPWLDSHAEWFYSGVDFLIVIGAAWDFVVNKRIHKVFLIGLPTLIAAQCALAAVRWSPWWLATAPGLFK